MGFKEEEMTAEQWKNIIQLLDERDILREKRGNPSLSFDALATLYVTIAEKEQDLKDFIENLEEDSYAKAQKECILLA